MSLNEPIYLNTAGRKSFCVTEGVGDADHHDGAVQGELADHCRGLDVETPQGLAVLAHKLGALILQGRARQAELPRHTPFGNELTISQALLRREQDGETLGLKSQRHTIKGAGNPWADSQFLCVDRHRMLMGKGEGMLEQNITIDVAIDLLQAQCQVQFADVSGCSPSAGLRRWRGEGVAVHAGEHPVELDHTGEIASHDRRLRYG